MGRPVSSYLGGRRVGRRRVTSYTRNCTRRNIFLPGISSHNRHRNSCLQRGMICTTFFGVTRAVGCWGTRSYRERGVTRVFCRFKRFLFTTRGHGKGGPYNGNTHTNGNGRRGGLYITRFYPLLSTPGCPLGRRDDAAIGVDRNDEGLSTPGVAERDVPRGVPDIPVVPTLPF